MHVYAVHTQQQWSSLETLVLSFDLLSSEGLYGPRGSDGPADIAGRAAATQRRVGEAELWNLMSPQRRRGRSRGGRSRGGGGVRSRRGRRREEEGGGGGRRGEGGEEEGRREGKRQEGRRERGRGNEEEL